MSHIVPDDIYLPFAATLIDGVPNCLYGEVENSELEANLSTNNLPAVVRKPDLVRKMLRKEERNHLLFTFSRTLSRFTPDIGIIKLGILEKEGKNDRVYRHGSKVTNNIRQPINKCCNAAETEATIKYGTVFEEHCQLLWSIAAHYPGSPIDMYDDDISGAFPQLLLPPGIAKANVSIFQTLMFVSIALHFGGNFGPAGWEPQPAMFVPFL